MQITDQSRTGAAVIRWRMLIATLVGLIGLTACTPVQPATSATPASQVIDSFVWQTDGTYGYRMLRPASWTTSDLVTARGYFPADSTPQTAPLLLTAVNLEALATIAAATQQEVVPFRLFQQNPELLPWTAAMEKQWQAAGLPYTFVAALPNGLLYAFAFPDAGFITLAAYVVNVDQPFLLQLTSREATTLEQLRDQGILPNFVTMAESITPAPHTTDQGAPVLTEEDEQPVPVTDASDPPPMVYVDQNVPGAVKLALLGYTQQSTAEPVASVNTAVAHPTPADICHSIYEATDSYDKSCERTIERYQLEQGAPTIARTDEQLTLTLQNGHLERFTDQTGEGGGGWARYSYLNYLPELNAYLLHVQYYEDSDYLLVQATDGRKLALTAPPIIAPDGKHFFTTFNLFDNPLHLFLWQITDGWAVPQQSLRFEPINRFAGAITSAAWLSPTALAVTVAGLSNRSGGTINVTIEPELAITFNGTAVTRPAIDPWRVTYYNTHVRQVDTAKAGKAIYADRDYVFTELPSFLVDQPYFLFENSQMHAADDDYVQFQLYRPVTLYVAIDEQACTLPGWLADWTPVDDTVATTDIGLKLYAKPFAAGDVVVGGNGATPAACIRSHYLLFVVAEATTSSCSAPAAIADVLTNYRTASLTEVVYSLQKLYGSSRPLFDVQTIAVENSEAVGLPMVIGTWGESWVFRLGGFFAWQAADGQWLLQSFCLSDEKLVAARMASAKDTAALTIIWNPCDNNSMGRCHQVQRYRYDRQGWQEQWQAVPGKDGWPYSHAEAQFVGTGIDTIRIKSSSWAPQADPQYPQDAKSQIFAEANPNPHRWFTDTWQYQEDHYVFIQREVKPSAYNTLVEFIYALKSGSDAAAWVTDRQVITQAQQAGVASLPERSLFCLDDWQTGWITGPIKIGACDEGVTVSFVAVAGQYLIDRIAPK